MTQHQVLIEVQPALQVLHEHMPFPLTPGHIGQDAEAFNPAVLTQGPDVIDGILLADRLGRQNHQHFTDSLYQLQIGGSKAAGRVHQQVVHVPCQQVHRLDHVADLQAVHTG